MSLNNLKTGDLILFNSKKSILGKLIEYFTNSEYSHIGIVLKDPEFLDKPLKGLYLWESGAELCGDAEDKKFKLGVEITNLREVLDNSKDDDVYVRKLNLSEDIKIDNNQLKKIYDIVHNKPYDIIPTDWLEAWIKIDPNPQKVNRFWCSALTGFIYTQLGLLSDNFDWSIARPGFFSSENKELKLEKNCFLENEVLINKFSLE